MLASCIHKSNLHILGLAETHLVGQSVVDIEGYTWFGHNRKHIHVRARTGSGGVGVLVRNDVLVNYNVDKVSDSVDGILWIRFSEKKQPGLVLLHMCDIFASRKLRTIGEYL